MLKNNIAELQMQTMDVKIWETEPIQHEDTTFVWQNENWKEMIVF